MYLHPSPSLRSLTIMTTLLLLSLGFGLPATGYAQQSENARISRQWKSAAGTVVDAELVGQTDEMVELLIKGQPAARKIPIAQLSEADQKYLAIRWFNLQDQRQFELVKDHLRTVAERPQTVSRLLIEIHNEIKESPYAGLWAAVTLSCGSNEHSRAAVLLEDTLRRIEKQQDADPSRHRMTFCSANNNLAICLIKGRKGDSAATRMVRAIESVERMPPIVQSNAELLHELTTNTDSFITFSPSTRQRLMRTVALSNNAGSGTKLEAGWHYTLDFDVPSESDANIKIDGIDAPRPDLQLLATGTGFVVSPGIVLTARPVVETTNYHGPKLITVIVDPASSSRRSELVRDLLISSTRSVAVSSSVGSGFGSGNVVWTHYSYVRPQNGQMGAEIAALRVPNLKLAPVEVALDDPTKRTAIRILGFSRGQAALQRGLQTQAGEVLQSQAIRGSVSALGASGSGVTLQTSARVMGGNRGGPVLDAENRVVGIAYDTPVSGSDAKGFFFGSGEFRRWFYENVQTASLTDVQSSHTATQRLNTVEKSSVAVYCWGLRQKSTSQLFSEVADSSRDSGGLYLRDNWCVACDGRGFLDCPVRTCNKGVVAGRETVVKGVNPLTGRPIRAQQVTQERCSTCNGKGGRICPHCKGGKI